MAVDMLETVAGDTELDRLRGIAARLITRVVALRERLGQASMVAEEGVNDALAEMNRRPVDQHRLMCVV